MNRALIGLASNSASKEQLLERAISELTAVFPSACFSACYQTDAVGVTGKAPYCNCVGVIDTTLSFDEVQLLGKEMERKYGRTSSSKQDGIIPLDIDIIVWNGTLLRANDWGEEYTQIGVRELGYQR